MKQLLRTALQKIGPVVVLGAGWLAGRPLAAQPTVVGLAPARNTLVARDGTVRVDFSTTLQASSATALQVVGTQCGGNKPGVAQVNGSQLTFKTNTKFLAGEKLWLTLSRDRMYGTTPGQLNRSQVWQLTAAATGGTGQFTPAGLLDWTSEPSLLGTGDVNGDGYPDVLAIYTTNGDYSSTLSIRLNDGTGTYAAIADQKLPYYVSALTLGDLDNDGDLDLVAAGARPQDSGCYSVLLNRGAGVFNTNAQVNLPSYTPQNTLELADLNADGYLDIIMPMKQAGGTNVLAVRLNNTKGGFTNTALLAGTVGSEAAVGDLDDDGDLDLVTADAGGKLVLSLNSGSGAFTSAGPTISTVAGYSQKPFLADLDGDGDLDVLLASNLPQVTTVLVRLNNGAGAFSAGTTITLPDRAEDLALADLDGDQDLLYCYGQHVLSQVNTGRATFGPGTDVLLSPTPRRLAISDIDGDGDLDVLAAGNDYQVVRRQVVVLRNGPAAPPAYAVTAVAPAANRPAARRAAVAATYSGPLGSPTAAGLRVLGSLGTGRVAGALTAAGSTLALAPAAAYLTGELMTASATKVGRSAAGAPLAQPYVWQFTAAATGGDAQFGGGVRVQFSTLNNHPLCLKLADIDGDGDLDILTAFNASSSTNYDYSQPLLLSVQHNDGQGRFAAPAPLLGAGVWGGNFMLADVDGDGDLDYLGGAGNYDPAAPSTAFGDVRLNDGRGTFVVGGIVDNAHLGIYGSSFAWGVGDLDGDGDPDLMNGGVRLNDGQGNFYGAGALANVDYVRGSVLADLDNDGDLDCITSTDAARDHFVHLNDGSGTLTQGVRIGTGVFDDNLLVRDIDGDGDVDLITGGGNSLYTYTELWLNNGQAKFNRGLGVGGLPLAVGDLDGDGDFDLVTTDGCFLNNGSGVFGAARSASLATKDVCGTLGDLDGDGDLDYVGVADGLQGWTIRFNAGQALAAAVAPAGLAASAAWPNPVASSGHLTLGLPGPGPATLTLRTLLGQLVWEQAVSSASPSVPVGSVPPGVYVLTWARPGQVPATQRLTVE